MKDAVKIFKCMLEEYNDKINASKQKMLDIYSGKTPQSPFFEFSVTSGISNEKSVWANTPFKDELSREMQKTSQMLQLVKGFDFIPSVSADAASDSGHVARLLGSQIEDLKEKGINITRHAIETAADVDDLVMPDLGKDPYIGQLNEHVKFLADTLEGCVDIVYPQLQGPASNSFRVIPQEESLISCLTDPEHMEKLGNIVTRITIDVLKKLVNSAGGFRYFRPRARFYQPEHIKGLFVDDWVSIISPESYMEIYRSSWEMMYQEMGPIFLHTCGPIDHCSELLTSLPGLAAMETTFIKGQSKTVSDLISIKRKLNGRITLGSFGGPLGNVVQDEENLTPDVLRQLSNGGHFAIQAHGTIEYAAQLTNRLGL